MTVSKSSAIMSDPYVLSREYDRITVENDNLVQKVRKLDVENRSLKRINGDQTEAIRDMIMEIVRLKQIVEKIDPSLLE